jgi:hypothetical protein
MSTNTDNSVNVNVDVHVSPAVAFDVFVHEIDAWFKVDRHTVPDFTRTVGIRLEPGVGGRLLDVYDADSGDGREMGRVTVWEPERRLVFVDNRGTEVEVTFEKSSAGTRVISSTAAWTGFLPKRRRASARTAGSCCCRGIATTLPNAAARQPIERRSEHE